jgi:hypothetical protein
VLSQAIEKQLDGIEHGQRFTRAVSAGNPQEFFEAERRRPGNLCKFYFNQGPQNALGVKGGRVSRRFLYAVNLALTALLDGFLGFDSLLADVVGDVREVALIRADGG